MAGDFGTGHSQYQTWDGSSQTPDPFAFTFPPLNINWDDPNLYSRLPPLNSLLDTLQNKQGHDEQFAGHMTRENDIGRHVENLQVTDRVAQDRQSADGPAQCHDISQPAVSLCENDIGRHVDNLQVAGHVAHTISQPVESLAQGHTEHEGNTNTQDTLGGAATGVASNANNLSWAARNPNRPIIELRAPLNPAQKAHANAQRASRKISSQQRKESEEALHSSIRRLLAEQAQRMDEIALEHGVSVEKVKKLVGGTRHYTASRSTQLENTLMHVKAEEVNKGNVLHLFEH
jgi:hypothetical protein